MVNDQGAVAGRGFGLRLRTWPGGSNPNFPN